MTDARLSDIECYVLPGHVRYCHSEFTEKYNTAYDFWRVFMGYEMRSEGLDDVDGKLASDSFMLFEDIYTLFYGETIVGLFCFDTKHMNCHAMRDQSFFKTFPENILEKYISKAEQIMTIGHLLVHPDWRRGQIGVGLSDVLVWFMHKRFVDSGSDLMIYWTRNNRSTNQLGIKFGGECVLADQAYGGLTADVIVTRPQNVVLDSGDETVNQLSLNLWENRVFADAHKAAEHQSPTPRYRLSP